MVKKAAPKAEVVEPAPKKPPRAKAVKKASAPPAAAELIPEPAAVLNDDLEAINAGDGDGFVEHMRLEALKLSVASNPQHSTADILIADAKKFASYILTGE